MLLRRGLIELFGGHMAASQGQPTPVLFGSRVGHKEFEIRSVKSPIPEDKGMNKWQSEKVMN